MFCYRESGEAQRDFQHEQEISERMALKFARIHDPTPPENPSKLEMSELFSQHNTKKQKIKKRTSLQYLVIGLFLLIAIILYCLWRV